jgi:uncharacterized protein (TIGR03437 family)
LLLVVLSPLLAQRGERFAIVLQDPPLTQVVESARQLRERPAQMQLERIQKAQAVIQTELAARGITVTGRVQTLVNAMFVRASASQIDEVGNLPGVRYIQPMLPLKLNLSKAVDLVQAPAAWNALGGVQNAGSGVKIAVLDTGIDNQHPAFQDSSLRPPDGFPKVDKPEWRETYTNNKVIVARSYVDMLVLGDEPEFSRPDDLTPRDRVGHGTAAAAVAAGVQNSGPAATIRGVAPRAFLGNYKIFGSPGVNDVTFDDVVIQALDDAFRDGMDIASLSIGRPALWAPGDSGSICGKPGGQACDLRVEAVNNAVRKGLTVVVSAGNGGDSGLEIPSLNTVHSPGTASGALTVGATTNSHRFFASLRPQGPGVPAALQRIDTLFGNGPKPASALAAPLVDVSKLEDNGRACSPLTNNSLSGALALIERGDCALELKVNHAQRAGAVGAVIFQQAGNEFVYSPQTLQETGIPAVVIGNTAGKRLKDFLAANPGREAALDPALTETAAAADEVAYFSSQGPAIDMTVKPELVAVGTDLYLPTQKFDPNGSMFDPSGYTNAAGTSFSAPMAAGAAALVKQQFPGYTPAQIKSALVNTASASGLTDFDYDGTPIPARVTAVGAGKLNAAEALRAAVTSDPAAVSFGLPGRLPVSRTLRLTNGGTSQLQVSLRVNQRDQDANARVTVTPTSATLPAGGSSTITLQLQGTLPKPGDYQGDIVVTGGGAELRIPYLYFATANVAFNAFSLAGQNFVGVVGETLGVRLTAKFVDGYGTPVADLPVRFRSILGSGSVDQATRTTDELGIAEARVILGSQLGEQGFSVEGGGLTYEFYGQAMLRPTFRTDGVVNAASGRVGEGLAPGSYLSIFGSALSEALRAATTLSLPLSLANVSVSFDVPSRSLSLPGRLHFVSEKQINVQIPWELQGLTSAQLKVSIGDVSSALYTVPLKDYSPEFFPYTEPQSGRVLIAALDENYQLLGTVNPARRGRPVQLYANGISPVNNQPASGESSPSQPLASCRVTPTVTVGNRPAQVAFCGLAPSLVGLYQLNIVVPEDAPAGIQPVIVSAGGVTSQPGLLAIQ